MQEVLHALCDKNRKLPKRPSLSAAHGRNPPAELVTLMLQCWHQVTPPPLPHQVLTCTFIHSPADSFMLLFDCLFIQALICTLTHSFLCFFQSFNQAFFLSFFASFLLSFRQFIKSLTHSFTCSRCNSFIHSFFHSSIPSVVCSFSLFAHAFIC